MNKIADPPGTPSTELSVWLGYSSSDISDPFTSGNGQNGRITIPTLGFEFRSPSILSEISGGRHLREQGQFSLSARLFIAMNASGPLAYGAGIEASDNRWQRNDYSLPDLELDTARRNRVVRLSFDIGTGKYRHSFFRASGIVGIARSKYSGISSVSGFKGAELYGADKAKFWGLRLWGEKEFLNQRIRTTATVERLNLLYKPVPDSSGTEWFGSLSVRIRIWQNLGMGTSVSAGSRNPVITASRGKRVYFTWQIK